MEDPSAGPSSYATEEAFTFRFTVENFSSVNGDVFSPIFTARNLPWRLLISPRPPESVGYFLQCIGDCLNPDWSCRVQATLKIINQWDPKDNFCKTIAHLFNSKGNKRGSPDCMTWTGLLEPEAGFVVDDRVVFEVEFATSLSQMTVRILVEENFKDYDGFELYDRDKVVVRQELRVNRIDTLKDVEAQLALPRSSEQLRVWPIARREKDGMWRPVPDSDPDETIYDLADQSDVLDVFLEVVSPGNLIRVLPRQDDDEDVLLFFKYYDPEKEKLYYMGHLWVDVSAKMSWMVPRLCRRAGLPMDTDLDFYEGFVWWRRKDPEDTFVSLKDPMKDRSDGDIMVFQKRVEEDFRHPFSHYRELACKEDVTFIERNASKDFRFALNLGGSMNYTCVANAVSEKLNCDPSEIRLYKSQRDSETCGQPLMENCENVFYFLSTTRCTRIFYERKTSDSWKTIPPKVEGDDEWPEKTLFDRLPDEVLVHILRFVDFAEPANFALLMFDSRFRRCASTSITHLRLRNEEQMPTPMRMALLGSVCQQLKTLDLRDTRNSCELAILALEKCPSLQDLRSLRVPWGKTAADITKDLWESLAKYAKRLQTLHVSGANFEKCFVDSGEEEMPKWSLLSLSLKETSGIDNRKLQILGDCCPKLEKIYLDQWRNNWSEEAECHFVLSIKKTIRELSLRCGTSSSAAFFRVISQCRMLQTLDISYKTDALNREGLLSIASLPMLRSLKIWGPKSLLQANDYVDAFSGSKLSLLEELDLSDSERLNDFGLRAMVENCPKMRKMRLYHVANITRAAFKDIDTLMPDLKSLDVVDCPKISEEFKDQLKSKYKS